MYNNAILSLNIFTLANMNVLINTCSLYYPIMSLLLLSHNSLINTLKICQFNFYYGNINPHKVVLKLV